MLSLSWILVLTLTEMSMAVQPVMSVPLADATSELLITAQLMAPLKGFVEPVLTAPLAARALELLSARLSGSSRVRA